MDPVGYSPTYHVLMSIYSLFLFEFLILNFSLLIHLLIVFLFSLLQDDHGDSQLLPRLRQRTR
jgi:uncharacterized membrane protein